MRKKGVLLAALALLAFLLLAGVLDLLLPLAGGDRWLLWGGLGLLGLLAAVLVYLYLAPRSATPAAGPRTSDVEVLLGAANARLSAPGARRGKLASLPVILVLGPSGSTKTTAMLNSGLEAELLAGEVYRGEQVAPTAAVNVWFAQERVLVEAGGGVVEDADRWRRLVRMLRPSRLRAALGRGGQAPRAVVVCFSCEALLQPNAAEAVPVAARKLRTALADLAQQLGVRLPVYVLFTKADRIPHFEDYVRGMTRAEAEEILGATLPLSDVAPGAYADSQASRLHAAFQEIVRSLAGWRLRLLPREGSEVARSGAYEFPREVRKLTDLATQFLLELCRPSQLGVNPFLRGFYFTGVRPVTVSAPTAALPAAPAPGRMDLGATGVFSAAGATTNGPPAASPTGATRKVPEWTFLRRILPDVVLRDDSAMALTSGGTRVDLVRRGVMAAAAILLLLLSTGFAVSYANNRALADAGLSSLSAIAPLRATVGELPPTGDLTRLDSLRALLENVGGYERGGHPWRLGWGLYIGDDVHDDLRRAYFDRFDRLLWSGADANLVAYLQNLPDAPQQTSDYGNAYDALRAYLVTTTHPQESTARFLTPVVLRHWELAPTLDPARSDLVRRQFDFFGNELAFGNPYPGNPSEPIVLRTRAFLQRFAGVESFYRALLTEAGTGGRPIRFSQLYPGAASVLRNDFEVPAAFTREGWARAQATLADIDRLLAREDWVLGERASLPAGDRARLAADLRTRYVAEYVATWRAYLQASTVAGFAGSEDAARKLAVLSGNESPLLQLLALASQHTAVDTVEVGPVFQPVQVVTPPGAGDKLVGEANAPYLAALVALQAAMDQVAQAPTGPARQDAMAQAGSQAEQVNLQVRQLAQSFSVARGAGDVGLSVQRLLSAPIQGTGTLVRALPTAEMNANGAAFCRPFQALATRYPFNARSTEDASMEDVAAALQPGASSLWAFYDSALKDFIVRQGSRYAAAVGANPQPTATFVAFFNKAAEISTALFPQQDAGPSVVFTLRAQTSDAIPEVDVVIDGQTQSFTRTNAAAKPYTWSGDRARSARITGQVGGSEVTLVAAPDGPWALVRLLQQAQWERTGTGRYLLRWRVPADPGTLTAEINFANGIAVFSPGYLRLDCVSQIVR